MAKKVTKTQKPSSRLQPATVSESKSPARAKPKSKKDKVTVHQSVLEDDADFGDYSDKIEEIEFKHKNNDQTYEIIFEIESSVASRSIKNSIKSSKQQDKSSDFVTASQCLTDEDAEVSFSMIKLEESCAITNTMEFQSCENEESRVEWKEEGRVEEDEMERDLEQIIGQMDKSSVASAAVNKDVGNMTEMGVQLFDVDVSFDQANYRSVRI